MKPNNNRVFLIIFIYLLFGIIWALATEFVPSYLSNPAQRAMFESYDQIILVIASIFVLYSLFQWEEKQRQKSELEVTKLARVVQQFKSCVVLGNAHYAQARPPQTSTLMPSTKRRPSHS